MAQRPVYTALAEANQAWLAFKEGDFEEVLRRGEAALAIWQEDAIKGYPLRWTALFPLLGVALAKGEDADAVRYARALLAPTERPMPDRLTTLVRAAVQAWDEGQPGAAGAHLRQAVELAQTTGYL